MDRAHAGPAHCLPTHPCAQHSVLRPPQAPQASHIHAASPSGRTHSRRSLRSSCVALALTWLMTCENFGGRAGRTPSEGLPPSPKGQGPSGSTFFFSFKPLCITRQLPLTVSKMAEEAGVLVCVCVWCVLSGGGCVFDREHCACCCWCLSHA